MREFEPHSQQNGLTVYLFEFLVFFCQGLPVWWGRLQSCFNRKFEGLWINGFLYWNLPFIFELPMSLPVLHLWNQRHYIQIQMFQVLS